MRSNKNITLISLNNLGAVIERDNNAVKIVELEEQLDSRILHEMDIGSTSCHPHICNIIDVNLINSTSIELVMPYYPQNMHTVIQKMTVANDRMKLIPNIKKQLLSAINYLSSRDICHGDIKPDNILMNNNYDCILADFGISCRNINNQKAHEMYPVSFRAPELLLYNIRTGKNIAGNYHTDLWSLGITLYFFCHKLYIINDLKSSMSQIDIKLNKPYRSINGIRLAIEKGDSNCYIKVNNPVKDLIEHLLSLNPLLRGAEPIKYEKNDNPIQFTSNIKGFINDMKDENVTAVIIACYIIQRLHSVDTHFNIGIACLDIAKQYLSLTDYIDITYECKIYSDILNSIKGRIIPDELLHIIRTITKYDQLLDMTQT